MNTKIKMTVVVIALIVMILLAYQFFAGNMVREDDRFSGVFKEFLSEVYDKPLARVNEEDLFQIKYLRIEQTSKSYSFIYSFQDYYHYEPMEFETYKETVVIQQGEESYSPSDLQYFTGLTRLELYTDSWYTYVLPKQNILRSIVCMSDVSGYENSAFFEKINPDTLQEVVLYSGENLEDDAYILKDINMVRSLTLQRLVCDNPNMFKEFSQLEELCLLYPEISPDKVFETVEAILQCPELKRFMIEGGAAWYLSEEEWNYFEDTYGDRVEIECY